MRTKVAAVVMCVMVWSGVAGGEATVREMERALDPLRTMPVQYQGRVMPLEVMCRYALEDLTGLRDLSSCAPKGCASRDPVFTYLSLVAELDRWEDAQIFAIGYRPLRSLFGKDSPERVSFAQVEGVTRSPGFGTKLASDPRLLEALEGLVGHLQKFSRMQEDLAILPQTNREEPWLCPSDFEKRGTEGEKTFAAFTTMLRAFRLRDAEGTRRAAEELCGFMEQFGGWKQVSPAKMKLERMFSRVHPVEIVAWAYVIPLVLGVAALASARPGLARGAFVILAVVFVLHTAALGVRSYIAGRLPLSNTYEYAVMTAWATVGLALIFEGHFKGGVFTFLGSLLGSVSLGAATVAPIGRDITPLVPVLRSVWLQYHVLTVFIGYAAFLLAFAASAYYLFRRSTMEKGREAGLLSANDMLVRIGFLFLTLGIVTGCIWANLSWGRYWGWDPKEVWALITWLVYLIYLHMEAAGWRRRWLGPAASCVGFAFVIFTYLGVNYLLSGLHSYAG